MLQKYPSIFLVLNVALCYYLMRKIKPQPIDKTAMALIKSPITLFAFPNKVPKYGNVVTQIIFFLLLFVLLSFFALFAYYQSMPEILSVLQELSSDLSLIDFLIFSPLLIMIVVLAYMQFASSKGRLVIDQQGLHYRANLPNWMQNNAPMQGMMKDFDLHWHEIQHIHVTISQQGQIVFAPAFIQLEIMAARRSYILHPFVWYPSKGAAYQRDQHLKRSLWAKARTTEEREQVALNMPLVRHVVSLGQPKKNNFALSIDQNFATKEKRLLANVLVLSLIALVLVPFYQLIPSSIRNPSTVSVAPVAPSANTPAPVPVIYDLSLGDSMVLEGHSHNVLPLTFSPNGKLLASGSKDKSAIVWKNNQEKFRLKAHTDKVQGLAFSPNNKRLVTAGEDSQIFVWSMKSGKQLKQLDDIPHHNISGYQGIFSLSYSPDGQYLAAADWNGGVSVWTMPKGILEYSIAPVEDSWFGLVKGEGDGHRNSVNGVSFSPDSSLLASAAFDDTVKVWHTDSGKLLTTLTGASDWATTAVFSPDNSQIAASSYDSRVYLWDIKSSELIRIFEGHKDTVSSVAFSADGKLLVSGSYDRSVNIWRVDNGKLLKSLDEHYDYVNAVGISHGKIASSSGDNKVRIWSYELNTFASGDI